MRFRRTRREGIDPRTQPLRDLVRTSMDYAYYVSTYEDLKDLNPEEAAAHYCDTGWREGLNPAGWFDTNFYLTEYSDVASTGQNPFLHFIIYGRAEGKAPNGQDIDPSGHIGQGAEGQSYVVADKGDENSTTTTSDEPSGTSESSGAVQQRVDRWNRGLSDRQIRVKALVDSSYYVSRHPNLTTILEKGNFENAADYYVRQGCKRGHSAHPFFEPKHYLDQGPSLPEGVDPFEHYLFDGHAEGFEPSPYFDSDWYRSQYMRSSDDMSPLEHYVTNPQETYPNAAGALFFARTSSSENWFDLPHKLILANMSVPPDLRDWNDPVFLDSHQSTPDEARFTELRKPQPSDAPIFILCPRAYNDEQGSVQRSLEWAKSVTSGQVTLLCATDAAVNPIKDSAVRLRPYSESLDALSNVVLAAAKDGAEGVCLVVRVGVVPVANCASLLLRVLSDDSSCAIVSPTMLGVDSRVSSSGFEVRNMRLEPSGCGGSPNQPSTHRLRPVAAADARMFALRLDAFSETTLRTDEPTALSMYRHSQDQLARRQTTIVQGTTFARDEIGSLQPGVALPPADARQSNSTSAGCVKRRALVVDVGWPEPDRDAGSVYTFNLVRLLLADGFEVAFAIPHGEYDPTYVPLLAGLGVDCIYGEHGESTADLLDELSAPDVVHLFRYPIADRYLFDLRKRYPSASIIFHTLDLHGLRERRSAELSGNLRELNYALRVFYRELDLIQQADIATVVSTHEVDLIKETRPHLQNLRVLTIPVDIPSKMSSPPPTPRLCFVGSFKHIPNVDAVEWLLEEIWPSILRRRPDATLHIAGQGLPAQLLDDRTAVEYHGFVSDLDAFLRTMSMSIVPLRFGAGIKGKILTSMAVGLPVVATPVAVEGMRIVPDQHALVGASAEEIAAAVVSLLSDEERWNAISSKASSLVANHFSLDAVEKQLSDLHRAIETNGRSV